MNPMTLLLKIFVVCCVFSFAACDGGKGKPGPCQKDASGNCIKPSQCPTGQTRQNGVCKPTPPICEVGQHIEDNKCVVNTLVCEVGQVEYQGKCIKEPLDCPIGQHEENDECVVDPVQCPTGQIDINGTCVDNKLSVQIENQTACYNPQNGATRLIIQYVVRDASGKTVDPVLNANNIPTALDTNLYVNAEPIDNESLIDLSSELLNSDLVLSLVLDSSSSMLEHNPPAFDPMKNAAASILRKTKDTWAANNSQFHWELAWFNDLIYRPIANNAGEDWTIGDVTSIPEPLGAAFTGLYKAVAHMADVHLQLYQSDIAADERDQHVMIVFSDGKDNNSNFDNSDPAFKKSLSVNTNLLYEGFGFEPTTLESLQNKFNLVPNLRVFVIGFGDYIEAQELLKIAEMGHGRYFFGKNSTTLGNLFDTVQREFVTQLTVGAEIPGLQGEELFTIKAKQLSNGVEGQFSFTLVTGQAALPACEATP